MIESGNNDDDIKGGVCRLLGMGTRTSSVHVVQRLTTGMASRARTSAIVLPEQDCEDVRYLLLETTESVEQRGLNVVCGRFKTLQQALAYCRTTGGVATIVSLDIDHFKAINDRFGHEVGDDVLRALGEVLLKSVRKSDSVFRLGGEEFLLLLYDTDLTHGVSIAEKLRDAIATMEIVSGLTISASFGVACSVGHQDWKAWVKRSDIKLYEAKRAGRNRVVSELPVVARTSAPPNLAR